MSWTMEMYLASVVGAVLAMFWPDLVGLFKASKPTPPLGTMISSTTTRFAAYLVVGVIIGAVVAALGFAALLGDKDNQETLKAAGTIAYFTAFTAGFAAGALFEEPLKP